MITNYTGVSGSRTAYLIAARLTKQKKDRALIVVSTGRVAARLAEDLVFYLPKAEIIVIPEEEDIQILYEARNRESLLLRIRAMQALGRPASVEFSSGKTGGTGEPGGDNGTVGMAASNTDKSTKDSAADYEPADRDAGKGMTIVVAPISAALRQTESSERFRSAVTEIRIGEQIDPGELRKKLSEAGYTAAPVTESPGEFTSRGGILDIFPPAMNDPVRIEFFDDEVDSIRVFDKDTQRSLENLMSVVIGPAAEFIPTNEEKEKALTAIRREYDRRIRRVRSELIDPAASDGRIDSLENHKGRVTDLFEQSGNVHIFADFLEYFDIPKACLWDHMRGGVIAVSDPARVADSVPEYQDKELLYDLYARSYSIPFAASASDQPARKGGSPSVNPGAATSSNPGTAASARKGGSSSANPGTAAPAGSGSDSALYPLWRCEVNLYTPFPETIKGAERLDGIVNVRSRQVAAFNGQIDLFAAEVEKLCKAGYRITIAAGSADRNDRIREYLEIAEVSGNIGYRDGGLSAGFIMDDEKICYISGSDIFKENAKAPRKSKKRKRSADSIQFSDLHKGDYVVHEAHGIGRFEGIRPVTADGQTRDYIVIRYAGSDVLYIPTEQLDVIQKYIGNSGNAPVLSKLSGGSWKRTRERAKKAIMEIAEDLVRLYAERQAMGGYAFSEDTLWQREFEADFPYSETDDQLRATEEIKEDMQKALPMDRLLCGDVGYGKTEVAARAVFKCLSEGKQAAILAPTTLLVNQHYHNLRERFANFPFRIQELSRFRTDRQQRQICKELKDGSIDLIIGTHRMLSDDIKFKDLGLLVIDEEQRFGVRHKEKLKQMRKNIDVLTLSATPIPRTLNMSLTGIKDISIIEEPPGDRFPVHTYVTPYEEDILRNAIERELARGGQVFVVNNRITGLNQIAETVEKLVPDARVAIGHGRMSEETLENTMMDFIEGRTNVLIATTIIENGIDIPNANTMIIMNSDRFGLAQLYQLRGRVGRSNRLAYAYLMYQPGKVLTELARKRLTAIREFTEFGAGFKLAMRDLELRGAGNILGEAQSGHIESIGYELYCKEIDRAVRQLQGEEVTSSRSDISIDVPIIASIPASYISDETLRLQAYKKIAAIASRDDADDVADELLDRYGDVPDETMSLIRIAEMRSHAEKTGIVNISKRGKRVTLKYDRESKPSAYAIVMAKAEFGEMLTISSGRETTMSLYTGMDASYEKLLSLMRLLREAAENTPDQAAG